MSLLTTAIILFPMFLPVWRERPFDHDVLNPGPYPIHVEAELVAGLKDGWARGDQELRTAIAQQLGISKNRDAFDFLVTQMAKAQDNRVLATVLQQLAATSFGSPELPRLLVPFLSHEHPPVRYWSATLYGRLPNADLTQLGRRLRDEPSPMVREGVSAALLSRSNAIGADFFKAFWTDTNVAVRAEAFTAVAIKPGATDPLIAELEEACTQGGIPVRYALASHLQMMTDAMAQRLAHILVKDDHASIRSAVARAIGAREKHDLLQLLPDLAKDRDADVRQQAAASLGKFPTEVSRRILLEQIGDKRNLVRIQAEQSLVLIATGIAVPAAAATKLAADNADIRYHACRVLGHLEAKEYSKQVFTCLGRETRPKNVGSVIFALGQFKATFATDRVAALATHGAPEIREQVGAALGRLNVPKTYEIIKTLAFDKTSPETRLAAIRAMGIIGDGNAFNETLLKLLKSVTGHISGADRAMACWSIGRARPVSIPLMERLVLQATTPVIPADGMKEFEEDAVLASASFALSECSRADPKARPQAEIVLKTHSFKADENDPNSYDGVTMTPSEEVREVARQARAYLEGTTIEPVPRPTRGIDISYGRIREKKF